jgi:hypothetical protein
MGENSPILVTLLLILLHIRQSGCPPGLHCHLGRDPERPCQAEGAAQAASGGPEVQPGCEPANGSKRARCHRRCKHCTLNPTLNSTFIPT